MHFNANIEEVVISLKIHVFNWPIRRKKKNVPLIFMFYGFVIRFVLRVCANAFSMLSHIIDRAHFHIHQHTEMCMQRMEKKTEQTHSAGNTQYTIQYLRYWIWNL